MCKIQFRWVSGLSQGDLHRIFPRWSFFFLQKFPLIENNEKNSWLSDRKSKKKKRKKRKIEFFEMPSLKSMEGEAAGRVK